MNFSPTRCVNPAATARVQTQTNLEKKTYFYYNVYNNMPLASTSHPIHSQANDELVSRQFVNPLAFRTKKAWRPTKETARIGTIPVSCKHHIVGAHDRLGKFFFFFYQISSGMYKSIVQLILYRQSLAQVLCTTFYTEALCRWFNILHYTQRTTR